MTHRYFGIWFALMLLVGPVYGDSLDDFTNNLFSDLAPLLALFGERVTMQFMSQSLGWEDCVALAMAPVGIVTIIVAAIRVGGPLWLKAVIGRARENTAAAEIELMSSTSKEVCELYNGEGIVKCQGSAPVWEYICLIPKEDELEKPGPGRFTGEIEFTTLEEALLRAPRPLSEKDKQPASTNGHREEQPRSTTAEPPCGQSHVFPWPHRSKVRQLKPEDVSLERGLCLPGPHTQSRLPQVGLEAKSQTSQGLPSENRGASVSTGTGGPQDNGIHGRAKNHRTARLNTIVIRNIVDDAPNISLNLGNNESRTHIKLVALMGAILQAGIVVIFGIMTYHPGVEPYFRKDNKVVAKHAFPLAAGGTLMLVAGLFLCVFVVETSTVEERYEATDDYDIMIYWLQQGQTVGDQVFESFATFTSSPRKTFITSRRRTENHERMRSITVPGVAIALSGFILQFVGMRAMNSAASLAQLGAIVVMTVSRALVRPGFASSFKTAKLLPGFELDWLAWKLVNTRYSMPPESPWNTAWKSHGPHEGCSNTFASVCSSSPSQPQEETSQRHQHLRAWALATGGNINYRPLEKTPTARDDSSLPQTEPSQPVQSTVSRKSPSQLLATRRGLSQLANFQGTSSKIALNLSSALEKTLTLFFPECRSIELDWYVNTKYLGSATPRLLDSIFGCHIKPFHDGTSWKVMADDLDSALSLWSYTARGGEQPQVSGSEKSDDDSWLRSKIPRPSLRLFGPSDLWQFKQDLKVWAPGSLWETLLDLAEDTAGRKWFSNARVTGFTHRYEPQGTIGTETSNRYFSPRTPFDGGEPPAGFTWAVENHDPLELVFAKDLLFSFLCSATQMLEGPLKGRSERPTIMANRTFVESVGHLQNKTMDTLAAYLVDLGFGSEDEVYLTIATPLSMWDRLPIPFPFFEYRCTHFIASRKAGLWKIPSSTDICLPGYDRELRITHYHGLALLLEFNHVIYHELQLVTVEKLVSPIRITNALKRYVDWFSEEVDWDDLREFNISLRNVYSFQLRERDPIATLETISCPKHGSLYPNQYSQCMAADPSSQHAPTFHIAIGMTPLHLQVIESKNLSTELFHLVNERDICGLTPLHYACIKNPQAVERLLKGGADATLKDFRAYTPLHYACSSRSNLGVGDLLEAGATFDDQGIDGAFPTHLAAACGRTTVIDKMRPAMRNWNPKMVLVDAWRKKDFKGRIAVHWAAMHGQSTVIEMLKHDLDEEDNYGLTALHLTVIHDKCDVIKKLIELKADRNKKDKIGRTALKMAYQHGRQEAIKLLYSAEAEVDCHDDGIKTPDEQWLENIKAFRRVKIAAGEIEAESADTEGSEITMRSEGILSPWLQTMTHTEREPKGSGGDATV